VPPLPADLSALCSLRCCCRQRQFINLGLRVPTVAPDTWVAPNAVVVGDVDLFDRVSSCFHLRLRAEGRRLPLPMLLHVGGGRSGQCDKLTGACMDDLQRSNLVLCTLRIACHRASQATCPHAAHMAVLHASACCLPPLKMRHLQTSVWYGCVLRGDVNHISVGSFSKIQDGSGLTAAR